MTSFSVPAVNAATVTSDLPSGEKSTGNGAISAVEVRVSMNILVISGVKIRWLFDARGEFHIGAVVAADERRHGIDLIAE